MEIKIARREDVPILAKQEAVFASPLSEDALHALLSRDDASLFVAWEQGEIVAHGILLLCEKTAFLTNFTVQESARRQGKATQFLTLLTDRARMLGAEQICLNVAPTNLAALRLYEKAGFFQTEEGGTEENERLLIKFL